MSTTPDTQTQDQPTPPRVLGVIVADLDKSAIGTRSRLADQWGQASVLARVVERLLQVRGIGEVAVLAPAEQIARVWELLGPLDRVQVRALTPRPAAMDARVRIGRAWNLLAWRGGAGQWTVFDEEYHPAAIAQACASAFDGAGAQHVLAVHSHGVYLDEKITSQLVDHHLHKNHEMRLTYTPAAPGLSGMLLRADIVREMGDKQVMPWQLLGYDPQQPIFDTLIRDACMQVDPALSKIPNRFCADTDRGLTVLGQLDDGMVRASLAQVCLDAARGVAPGVTDLSRVSPWPREVEIQLTGKDSPAPFRSAAHWAGWLSQQKACDDLLLTFAGEPLLYPDSLPDVLRAARGCGALSICLQTDLAEGNLDALLAAIAEDLIDVVSVTMYGHTAPTYARVAGVDRHATVIKNMERLADATRARGGTPLVIPRLLKVRETIPELEPFFDFWILRCGWAVIDGPTDLAGSADFRGVVDMAPPKRKACRRLWDRFLIRADGRACACDQDIAGKLSVGSIDDMTLPQMWAALQELRNLHAAGLWPQIDPCKSCREWHRA